MSQVKGFSTRRFVVSLLLPFIAGAVGSIFTFSQITTWYVGLIKPAWNPPNWLFGPVWTILYILIGISIYLFWQAAVEKKQLQAGLTIAVFQLVVNALWSIVFFAGHHLTLSCMVIALLWVFIVMNIVEFWKVSRAAGILLLPYLLWVSFAGILNYAVAILN